MSCNLNTAICCLPFAGPLASLRTTVSDAVEVDLLTRQIEILRPSMDQTAEANKTISEARIEFEKKYYTELPAALKQGRVNLACAMIGNVTTVAAIAMINPVFVLMALPTCSLTTYYHYSNLSLFTEMLNRQTTRTELPQNNRAI